MNEILAFLIKHWQLSTLFVAVLVAYVVFELKQNPNSKQVSPEQAVALYNHEHGIIMDIRSAEDFAVGHIIGAMHVAADESDIKIKRLQKYSQKPVVIVCTAGKQSINFMKRLETMGFTQVLSLAGGIAAWQEAGLPLTTAKE
jgi:rhodanese-related sulfurtransferase